MSTADLDARCPLAAATPMGWLRALQAALHRGGAATVLGLLVEQAHLEKKAAAAATRLLFRVPYDDGMQRGLSTLAREELVHFERTLRLLRRRRGAFTAQQPVEYAEALKGHAARVMPERLVDELLIGAIIEARSCERMQLVAAALDGVDDELAAFYRDLVAAEERHRSLYLEIAATISSAEVAVERFARLATCEVRHLEAAPFAPRLHSGWQGVAGGVTPGAG